MRGQGDTPKAATNYNKIVISFNLSAAQRAKFLFMFCHLVVKAAAVAAVTPLPFFCAFPFPFALAAAQPFGTLPAQHALDFYERDASRSKEARAERAER